MTITVQVPDALLQDLATSPDELDREIRLAAAMHLYSRGLISQGKGAEIAGLSRWDFIQALGRAEVSACHVTSEELQEEVERALQAHRQRVAAHPSDQERTARDNVIADALKQAGE
jgi:predicted HTH domain antitoxin